MLDATSEEQDLLVETAKEFARGELLDLDRTWDEDESSMATILPRLSGMGFLSLLLPEEVDGLGCDYRTYAAILHEIAYASPSASVGIAVHNMVGSVLASHAAEPLRAELLPTLTEADSFCAFALSEANAGSDSAAVSTAAQRVDGGYHLNGEKMWITNGLSARWFLTLVRTTPGKGGLTAVLVDGERPGVGREKIRGKLGLRGSETAVIALRDVFVPSSHRIGAEGDGLKVFLSALDGGRIGIASQATGIAEACLDLMVGYAKQRQQFGRRIAEFQAIQRMVADSAVELAAARELVRYSATTLDAGRKVPAASSKAKLYATEAANRIAYRAVQVHGGSGTIRECRVEQLYRDVRVTTIYEGTSEIQRTVIARDLMSRLEN